MTNSFSKGKFKSALTVFVLCLSTCFFVGLANEVVFKTNDYFDREVFNFFHEMTSPLNIQYYRLITHIGSGYFLTIAYVAVLLLLLWQKRRIDALAIASTAIVSALLVAALKVLFARARPDNPLISELTTYSFPSGHTVSSFIFFGLMAWECSRLNIRQGWKVVLIGSLFSLAVLVGISRIVLRYHYASDVVGGWSLGIALLSIFILVQQRLINKSKAVN